jgi:hypothetical protein
MHCSFGFRGIGVAALTRVTGHDGVRQVVAEPPPSGQDEDVVQRGEEDDDAPVQVPQKRRQIEEVADERLPRADRTAVRADHLCPADPLAEAPAPERVPEQPVQAEQGRPDQAQDGDGTQGAEGMPIRPSMNIPRNRVPNSGCAWGEEGALGVETVETGGVAGYGSGGTGAGRTS